MVNRYPILLQAYKTLTHFWGKTTGFLYEDYERVWLITARHNVYYTTVDVDIYQPKIDYDEILIKKIVLCFRGNGTSRNKWYRLVLLQDEIMEYARTYTDFSLDIIAIEISSFLENNSLRERICPHHSVFSSKHLTYEVPIETEVYIAGFPSSHSLQQTLPKEYQGKVVQKGENTHRYGKYLFEINIDPPHGVSGSPVMSPTTSIDKEMALYGIYTGFFNNKKVGVAAYSRYIDDITKNGKKVSRIVSRTRL